MAIPVWRAVKGYEGLYAVNNTGQVKSLFRYKKVLKPNVMKRGYCTVELFKDGQSKRLLIHRLVAEAFIPNPYNFPQVNHIDENPMNNSADNLEWCTAKYNMNYGEGAKTRHLRIDYTTEKRKQIARENGKAKAVPVAQYKEGNKICVYDNARIASNKTGVNHSHILDVANGKRKTAGGYVWMYERG